MLKFPLLTKEGARGRFLYSMISRTSGVVRKIVEDGDELQIIEVDIDGSIHPSIVYKSLIGSVAVGENVVLNTTAKELHLGTGGYDFVMACVDTKNQQNNAPVFDGHIIKARYLPCQTAVFTLEEQSQFESIWDKKLEGLPVICAQLHSQVAPIAAALKKDGINNIVYIMTDSAALPIAFSRSIQDLKSRNLITNTITCGQAFGGDYETVTLHSALIAAKHILSADTAIVCQGPGNAGTGTKYGFGGIEQASVLDITARLGGMPVAVIRMSEADKRDRHLGISHHSITSLELVYSNCNVPVPLGTDISCLPNRHKYIFVNNTMEMISDILRMGIKLSSMGRSAEEDPIYFQAAVAAGMCIRQLKT